MLKPDRPEGDQENARRFSHARDTGRRATQSAHRIQELRPEAVLQRKAAAAGPRARSGTRVTLGSIREYECQSDFGRGKTMTLSAPVRLDGSAAKGTLDGRASGDNGVIVN